MKYFGQTRALLFLTAVVAVATSIGCSEPQPVPIHYGQDQCDYCRMNIVDNRFGSELLTKKGKAFKFDSIECLAAYLRDARIDAAEVHSRWITDFQIPSELISVESATIVHTETMRSPMGMGLFGFGSKSEAEKFAADNEGTVVEWETAELMVEEAWLK